MKKYLKLSIFLIFLPVVAISDPVSDENRLLKSWGLKFNAQGQLKFRMMNKTVEFPTPWKPDLSIYQSSETTSLATDSIKPLVISSKQKAEK